MKFEIIEKLVPYNGFFKMEKYRLKHELFAGGEGAEIVRELLQRGDAAAVLPYDPQMDAVVLVEQFRIGAINDSNGPWIIETIAGMAEPNESPEELVVREAIEEADCKVSDLTAICEYYCSPGGCSEKIHLFCGRTDASQLGGIHGCPDEGEDIKVHVVPFNELQKRLFNGELKTAMTLIAVQWLVMNRDKLRNCWR